MNFDRMTTGKILDWLVRTVIAVSIAIIGFLLRDLYKTQTNFNYSTNDRLYKIELFMERTEANRFTAIDFSKATASVTDSLNNLDKRTTRNEDNISTVKIQLDRMETKIDNLKKQ